MAMQLSAACSPIRPPLTIGPTDGANGWPTTGRERASAEGPLCVPSIRHSFPAIILSRRHFLRQLRRAIFQDLKRSRGCYRTLTTLPLGHATPIRRGRIKLCVKRFAGLDGGWASPVGG